MLSLFVLIVSLTYQFYSSEKFVAAWTLPFISHFTKTILYSSESRNARFVKVPRQSINHKISIDNSRRVSILSIPILCILPFFPPNQCFAADSTAAVEALRSAASKIPGYGEADIYFPKIFEGKYFVTQTIIKWDDTGFIDGSLPLLPLTMHQKIQQRLPVTFSYNIRFISVGGNLEKVVADRAFNEQAFYEALLKVFVNREEDKTNMNTSKRTIQYIQWSDTNPNVLTTLYKDGSSREIKVTKRATSLDEQGGLVTASEYRRITTTQNSLDGRNLPSISASRILQKWKFINDHIDGIELIYSEGSIADPLGPNKKDPSTTMVSKSILRMTKVDAIQ